MKNVLIIGCGLLGSSLVRRISKKKIAKKIFIYEKSKSSISKIKRLKLPGIIVKSLEDGVVNSDLIIFCTPMSEYKKLIKKINNFISPKTIITDVGSSKIESSKIIKKSLKRDIHWIQSHPITGSEVSGPEGVLAATALDAFGCSFQGRFIFETENDKKRAKEMGINDLSKKYEINEIVSGDSIFCATGITSGDMLSGIKIEGNKFISETLVTHKSSNYKKKNKVN